MPQKKRSSEQLDGFYEEMAQAAANSETVADALMRSEGLDPDEIARSMEARVRKLIAQTKLEEEEAWRSSLQDNVRERVQALVDQFGSATKALQRGLGEGELSLQFRKLEKRPNEEEAYEILVEEIELELSGINDNRGSGSAREE